MLKVIKKIDHHHGSIDEVVTLSFDERKKARLRTSSELGKDIGLFLPRAQVLQNGDCLLTECGLTVQVKAANENVTTAHADDWLQFSKVCYHLGNRHLPLQVGERWLRFQPDHVLEDLCRLYGLTVQNEQAPFNPENGAYAEFGGHSHGHHHD